MTEIIFVKDHPSGRFKKGKVIKVQDESLAAWLKSDCVKLNNIVGEILGNVEAPLKDGEQPKENSNGGGSSQKKSSKKKRNKKNKK